MMMAVYKHYRYQEAMNLRRDSASSFRMAVHLGDDDGTEIGSILERPTLGFSGLSCRITVNHEKSRSQTQLRTNARVQYQHRHIRLDCLPDLDHLLEQF